MLPTDARSPHLLAYCLWACAVGRVERVVLSVRLVPREQRRLKVKYDCARHYREDTNSPIDCTATKLQRRNRGKPLCRHPSPCFTLAESMFAPGVLSFVF